MLLYMLVAALAPAPERVFDVTPAQTVSIECTTGRTTRLAFPEAGSFQIAPSGAEQLGIKVESLREGRLAVTPPGHPLRTRLSFRGRHGSLVVDISTTKEDRAGVVILRWPAPAAAASPVPAVVAAPTVTPAVVAAAPAASTPAPTMVPSPTPTAVAVAVATPSPAAVASTTEKLDFEEYALAGKPIRLNETQGVPGQKRMVLVYAQQGPTHVWFRFVLEGGSSSKVKRVEGPAGEISAYRSTVEGKDLTVFAQLPKALWKQRGGMKITFDNDLSYKFRLRNPGLLRVLGDATNAVNPF